MVRSKFCIYKAVFLIALVCPIFFVVSCKPTRLQRKDYIKWIENADNGLKMNREISDFEILVQFKPTEYIIELEKSRFKMTTEEIIQRRNSLDSLYFYTVTLKSKDGKTPFLKNGIADESSYFDRLRYYLADAEHDFYLVSGKDTISPVIYHFEQNYGLGPYNKIDIAFESMNINKKPSWLFVYDDKKLGVGSLSFEYLKNNLENIPDIYE